MKKIIALLSIILSFVLLIPISFAVDDIYYFSSPANQLNLNEYLGNVDSVITSDDTPILASSILKNGNITSRVDQYLRFNETGGLKVVYDKSQETKKVFDYLHAFNQDNLFTYEMHFPEGFSSSVINSQISSLVDQRLMILGKQFTVANATVISNGATSVELVLVSTGINQTVIILHDSNIADAVYESTVLVDGEVIEDAEVSIDGSLIGQNFQLSALKYRLRTDAVYAGDLYISEAQTLKNSLDGPEGMLSDNWDIVYNGLVSSSTSLVAINPEGNDGYGVEFKNAEGQNYAFTLMTLLNDGSLKLGDDTDEFIYQEVNNTVSAWSVENPNAIKVNDIFVLTKASKLDSAITSVLEYDGVQTADGILTFTDVETGAAYAITFEPCTRTASAVTKKTQTNIPIGGEEFAVYINASDCNNEESYQLAIDLNGDGDISSADRAFITLKGGSILSFLGESSVNGSLSSDVLPVEIRVLGKYFDESHGDELLFLNISKRVDNQNQLYISSITSSDTLFYMTHDKGISDEKGMTTYGIHVTDIKNAGGFESNSIELQIPYTQIQSNVSIVYNPAVECQPQNEICNGIDDNCNGIIDENLEIPYQSCSAGIGSCQRNGFEYKTCGGVLGWSDYYGVCTAVAGLPSIETCNGVDDNCNGVVDENLVDTQSCIVNIGLCTRNGTQSRVCSFGTWGNYGNCTIVDGLPISKKCFIQDDDYDGVINKQDKCPSTKLPEFVPTVRLVAERYAAIDADTIFETRKKVNGPIVKSIYSLNDTKGCSCKQILDQKKGNNLDEKMFGCTKETITKFIKNKSFN